MRQSSEIESKADEALAEVVQDWAQGIVDVLVKCEVLEPFSIVRTIRAWVQEILAFRDQLLLERIAAFFDPLKEIPLAQREEMVRRLEADPSYNRKVGRHLVELLDRIDSHRKPAMLGYCVLALAQGRIDAMQLQRLMNAIERLPTAEIDSVRRFLYTRSDRPARDSMHPESIQALVNAGLAHWAQYGPTGGSWVSYRDNQTCTLFVELNLDVRSAEDALRKRSGK